MFRVEIDPTMQIAAILTGVFIIDHNTPIVASYLTETGKVVDGKPELIGSVALATFRDIYAMLAYLAEGAAMVTSDEYPLGEVHRMTVESDDSLNTVEITLSAAARLSINRIVRPEYRLSRRSPVPVVDWLCLALRQVPDRTEFFPGGKWATIQALEQMCLFQYSDLYEPSQKMGLL